MHTDRLGDDPQRALRGGSGTVAVYGLGLAGLSLAAACVGPAGTVRAVSQDTERVERLADGELPSGVAEQFDAVVETGVAANVLQPTEDGAGAAAAADVHAVATPIDARSDRVADLSRVRTAVRDVATGLSAGDLVVVESPVPPGTTVDLVAPLLADEAAPDLGEVGLAYCATDRDADRTGRSVAVVGGRCERSTTAAAAFYDAITVGDVETVASPTVAEMAATGRDVYRYVEHALVGELAQLAEEFEADVNQALGAAESFLDGSLPDPVPGPRGHVLPFAPYRLLGQTGTPTPLVAAARELMIDLPEVVVNATVRQLHATGTPTTTATVAVLGLLPVPDGTVRQVAPAVPVTTGLDDRGATVLGVDPEIDDFDPFAVDPATLGALPDRTVDAVVVLEDRSAFHDLDWSAIDASVVVDAADAVGTVPCRRYVLGRGLVE